VMYQWGRPPIVGIEVVGSRRLADAWNLYCASSTGTEESVAAAEVGDG
jgi:hypothetical protein